MPGEKRKVPLEADLLEQEEWEAEGLPRQSLVISKPFGKPSGTLFAGTVPSSGKRCDKQGK